MQWHLYVWPSLPLIGMTLVVLVSCVAIFFLCFLLQMACVWLGEQFFSPQPFLDFAVKLRFQRRNRTRLTRRERKLEPNKAETQAILQARVVLKRLPDPPTAAIRHKIDALVAEQSRILAELDKPRVFMSSLNSIRDVYEEKLLEVRRQLLCLDPKRIDYSYYLRNEGEVSE